MPKKEKRASPSAMKDLAVRGLLIVFSILLALFLDGIREQQKVTADLTTAYRSIRIELESNRDTLATTVKYHLRAIEVLDSLLQGEGREMTAPEFAGILSPVLPKGPNLPNLQDAAWNTLHSTGLITNLKFDDVYPFVKLYGLQKEGVERVSAELTRFLSGSGPLAVSRNTPHIKTLALLLHELYEQEQRLLAETKTALSAGQNWRYLE